MTMAVLLGLYLFLKLYTMATLDENYCNVVWNIVSTNITQIL